MANSDDSHSTTTAAPAAASDAAERAGQGRVQAIAAAFLTIGTPGLFWLTRHPRPDAWWLTVGVIALLALAELFPIDLELRHESHSFSFAKVPTVISVFLLAPFVAVLARLTASAIVLIAVKRQPPIKLVVNLLAHMLEVMIAAALVVLLRPPGPFGVPAWGVAALAVTAGDAVAAFVISSAISAFQGRWEPGLLSGVATGLVAGVPDVALAIAMVTMIEAGQAAAWVVLASGIAFVAVCRAYSKIRARYQAMQLLDRFTRAIAGAVLNGTATGALLTETAEILHADGAWLIVADASGTRRITAVDAVVAEAAAEPLDEMIARHGVAAARLETDDGPLGDALAAAGHLEIIYCPVSRDETRTVVLVVADRSGSVRPFDDEDVTLFETLASHAGLALLNVDLVNQLRDEITVTEHQATHDALTGLPNRTLFQARLESAIEGGEHPAVLLIDLDRFKDVNDTLGHHNGDRLLREIARRLESSLGTERCVARLGGDEFAALLTGSPSRADAISLAFDLAATLERPVTVADVEVDVGASIGIAFESADGIGTDTDTLLRQADVAMYTAKADRSVVEIYSADRDNYSPQRLSLVGRLRSAIDNGDLVLNYQPQVELATGEVVGVEALVRWPQPGRGPIPPDEFIYIAEHTGLIRPLSRLVIDRAVIQAARWYHQGRRLRMSLNLSPHNLVEPDIVGVIADKLAAAELPPDRLMIELTESTVMANPKRTLGLLNELRELGIGVAIDDFGTGTSSLAYLTTLPANELKIDKSFVFAIGSDPTADSIVRSIIDLGRNLNLGIIAEGVETEQAAQTLIDMGCRFAQGYLYSRPLEVRAFEHWHANHDANRHAAGRAGAPDPTAFAPAARAELN
ncbi:MAG TPA: EAL domain-containing protein [Microthrixaceae bacterium]|nr:EAL domain-containing protein [Microthrixaceae bacterium]